MSLGIEIIDKNNIFTWIRRDRSAAVRFVFNFFRSIGSIGLFSLKFYSFFFGLRNTCAI